ncbi:MAG: hypothetical protein NUV76_12345 [Candidatus Kuenenia sp.]|nr:hypothetical protein [Candidatus Kuenenia sp.]
MNVQELFLKDGKSAGVYYCEECKIITKKKEDANNCCKRNNCKYCSKLVEEKYWLAHRECIEKDKMEKAEKLDTWDGWVFYEDKYYETIETLIEELEDNGDTIPQYVYICKESPFPAINIDHLIERIEENSYEEIIDSLVGLDELTEAINDFNENNKKLVSYLPDETKKVKIKFNRS